MATFKFKVLKGGKVYGEATTKAEAEAVAKKIGGSVAEVVGAKPAAKKPKARNPAVVKPASAPKIRTVAESVRWVCAHPESGALAALSNMVGLVPGSKECQRVWGQFFYAVPDASTREYSVGDTVLAFLDFDSGGRYRWRSDAPCKQPKPKNPPLERANAASLLDAVKPGKPQVIHGVKVARVGAGYSIDRMVLSRELAIKRLEGGKVGNPKPNPKAVKAKAKPKPKTTAKPKKPATRKPAKTAAKVTYI